MKKGKKNTWLKDNSASKRGILFSLRKAFARGFKQVGFIVKNPEFPSEIVIITIMIKCFTYI